MLRFIFTIVSFVFFILKSDAQGLKVESFTLEATDISASIHSKLDLNGNACALIKVDYPYVGAAFEGNIIDEPLFKTNEYWVYMSPGSKQIKIHTPGHHTLYLAFSNYNLSGLEARRTYYLKITSDNGDKPTFNEILSNVPLYQIHRNSKFGFVDSTGKEVVPPIYEHNVGFNEGLAQVTFNGKVGYIDKSGRFIINPSYEIGWGFKDGIACVKNNGKWGAINHKGDIIVPTIYDKAAIGGWGDGHIPMLLNGKYCIVDDLGRMTLPPTFDDAWGYSCGLCAVFLNGDKFFINTLGDILFKPSDETGIIFKYDLLRAKHNGKWGYVDKSGAFAIEPKFDYAGDFSQDAPLAPVAIDGKYGYVNTDGDIVIPLNYDSADRFYHGYAAVKVNGKYGVINEKGDICILPQYDSITVHSDGAFCVTDLSHGNFEQYYIDLYGHKIADYSDGSPIIL